jgi:fibronectin-binding autotransporter adhesin
VLGGNNTYTGSTTVSAGILTAFSHNALGTNSAVTVDSGAALVMGSNVNLSIGSLAGSGTVIGGGATVTAGGNNTATTFSGTLSTNLVKVGTGAMTFNGTHTAGNNIAVEGGALALATAINSPSSSVRVGPNGILAISSGASVVQTRVQGIGAGSRIVINTNTALGEATAADGFSHEGTLVVNGNIVTLNSQGFAQLGVSTTMTGGTINAPNGVAFGSGSTLSGRGTVSPRSRA